MDNKISVVINTLNEEKNIERAIASVRWADEVIVCDMYSEDSTASLAKRMGARVVFHKKEGYVEPARNFAINEAKYGWILVLDADEEIPAALATELKKISGQDDVFCVEIPRKNMIFGKWMRASFWWPDFQPRFFKKGTVVWKNEIHSKPNISGKSIQLPIEEQFALIHYHYENITQFIERMNRYTTIQAKDLEKSGYKFIWTDMIDKPLNEFLGRFFANRGYEDGLHGLALSLLQAFSFLIMYLKIWEATKFEEQKISIPDLKNESDKAGNNIGYWFKFTSLSNNPVKRVVQKAWHKLT